MQAAHGLHNGVDGRILQDQSDVLDGFRIRKGNILQAQDLGDLHIFTGSGDFIDAPAHNAEAQ